MAVVVGVSGTGVSLKTKLGDAVVSMRRDRAAHGEPADSDGGRKTERIPASGQSQSNTLLVRHRRRPWTTYLPDAAVAAEERLYNITAAASYSP